MFDRDADYPTAVASYDDVGVSAAIDWCSGLLQADNVLTVWTSLKSNLSNCGALEDLVNQHSNVEHVTGRGGAYLSAPGPVLMAWPDMGGIGELVKFNAARIRGLAVITWVPDWIRPWVTATNPAILGDGSDWSQRTPALNPVVVEAMKSLTLTVNHNNTIAAGYEKDEVVGTLLALSDARIPLDAEAMQGWALANGWAGKNPRLLAGYVRAINDGKRPRTSHRLGTEYVDYLRAKAANTEE